MDLHCDGNENSWFLVFKSTNFTLTHEEKWMDPVSKRFKVFVTTEFECEIKKKLLSMAKST